MRMRKMRATMVIARAGRETARTVTGTRTRIWAARRAIKTRAATTAEVAKGTTKTTATWRRRRRRTTTKTKMKTAWT
jgi:hypothetical protein